MMDPMLDAPATLGATISATLGADLGADLLAQLASIATGFDAMLLLLLPLELLWLAWHHRLGWARLREMLASASTLPLLALFGIPAAAAYLALYRALAALLPWSIATGPWAALACLVVVDFLYYWDHRLAHRIRGLWALYHSVHHSSPVYDQSTALRVSCIDVLVTPLFYLPAVLLGFDPLLVLASYGIVIAYQTWLHTELIGRLPGFDRIFNSPSNHRVHHGTQRPYLDRNYGAILMLWDHLFGTYAAEAERPDYGLTEPIHSSNPVVVHGLEIARFWRDCRRFGWHRAWDLFWRRPGWTPSRD